MTMKQHHEDDDRTCDEKQCSVSDHEVIAHDSDGDHEQSSGDDTLIYPSTRHDDDDDDDDDLVTAMKEALAEGERQAQHVALEGASNRAELQKRQRGKSIAVIDIWGQEVPLQSSPEEWQGIALAGGLVGTMMGGPMLGFYAAVTGMTLAATNTGKVGDMARSGGAAVALIGSQLLDASSKRL